MPPACVDQGVAVAVGDDAADDSGWGTSIVGAATVDVSLCKGPRTWFRAAEMVA